MSKNGKLKLGEPATNGQPLVAYTKTSSGKVVEEFTVPKLTTIQEANIEERKKYTGNKKYIKPKTTVIKDDDDSKLRIVISTLSNRQRSFLLHVSNYMTEDNLIYFNQVIKTETIIEKIATKMGIFPKAVRNILYSIPKNIIYPTHSGIEMEYMISSEAFVKSGVSEESLLNLHKKISEQPTSTAFLTKNFDAQKDWLRTGTVKNNYPDSANRTNNNGSFTYPTIR